MSARRRKAPEQALFAFAEESGEKRRGMDELFASLVAFQKASRFLQLLTCMARFSDYGPYNALLAAVQRPNATCVLPPSKWTKYNRELKRVARPIVLLRPFAPVFCVFDIADTRVVRGRPDRLPSYLRSRVAETPASPVPEATVRRLLARLPWWGILHEALPTGPAAQGEIHLADGREGDLSVPVADGGVVPWRPVYVLRTRTDVPPTDLFAAVVRELARLFCHHLMCGYEKGWGDGRSLTPDVEAFEVEVALWLVSRRIGVASPAYAAVDDYFTTHPAIPETMSMDAVVDAVGEIETMLGECTLRDGSLFKTSHDFAARVRAGDVVHPFQQEITTT